MIATKVTETESMSNNKKEITEKAVSGCQPYELTFFVGNLPQECKKQNLVQYLQTETNITNIVMNSNAIRLNNHCKILKYAFVTFSEYKSIEELNNKYSSQPFLKQSPLKFEQFSPAENSTSEVPRVSSKKTKKNRHYRKKNPAKENRNSIDPNTESRNEVKIEANENDNLNYSTATTIIGEEILLPGDVKSSTLEDPTTKGSKGQNRNTLTKKMFSRTVPQNDKNTKSKTEKTFQLFQENDKRADSIPSSKENASHLEENEENIPSDNNRRLHNIAKSKDTLFVSNLPFVISTEELSNFFSVEESCIHLPMRKLQDLQTGRIVLSENKNRGFSFVTFNKFEENETIDTKVNLLSGKVLHDRKLHVDVATEKKRQSTAGIATAIISMSKV